MPFRILVADDDENVRKSHKFAIDAASELLKDKLTVVESDDSVDALAKIKSEHFDLIIVDNDFKDKEIHGHLPGVNEGVQDAPIGRIPAHQQHSVGHSVTRISLNWPAGQGPIRPPRPPRERILFKRDGLK